MGGGAASGGGMSSGGMGMAGVDIANPTLSNIINNVMYYGAWVLPKVGVYKTIDATPSVKKPGVKRQQIFYGPLKLMGKDVSICRRGLIH
jgi:hypothetical protein